MDQKEGHIIPSFRLAASLKERGHTIVYLTIADNRKLVEEEGFLFYPVFQDIYPEGFHQANKRFKEVAEDNPGREKRHLLGIIEGELDVFFAEYKPDLLIASAVLGLEMLLLHYKYHINPVIMSTSLREPPDVTLVTACVGNLLDLPLEVTNAITEFVAGLDLDFTSLKEMLYPLEIFYELVLCPRELDMDMESVKERVFYLGPTILQQRSFGRKLDLDEVKSRKQIIYASLGSHAVTYGDACIWFFQALVNVMKYAGMQEMHLVLSVGLEFDAGLLGEIPGNVTVVDWVSQTDILKDASLVITHGGLGTIKESIYYGVPMIVFPMGYEQPRNAMLIEYHRLGISAQIENITEEGLISDIRYILNSPKIFTGIKKMQKIFREKEIAHTGVDIIEQIIREHAPRPCPY